MVMSKARAGEKYKKGLEIFGGAAKYIACGKEKDKGFLAVAKCLEDGRVIALTTDNMVSKYIAAA